MKDDFIGPDQAFDRRAPREPSRFVGSGPELHLQLQGGGSVRSAGHQISRPEPDGKTELRPLHDGSSGHRTLLALAGTIEGVPFGLEHSSLQAPAGQSCLASAFRSDKRRSRAHRRSVAGTPKVTEDSPTSEAIRAWLFWFCSISSNCLVTTRKATGRSRMSLL